MVGKATLFFPAAALAAAFVLIAAEPPPMFAQAQPGLWEMSGAPGLRAPVRQCIADINMLVRFEHRSKSCTSKIIKQNGSTAQIEYSCGAAGFGHSEVTALTPRSLRIETQGISDGLPFNYVVQARRVDDCPKTASAARH
jgi:hypothetical protein